MSRCVGDNICGNTLPRTYCCYCGCAGETGTVGPRGPRGYTGPKGDPGEKGEPGTLGPFLSSYVECLANAQTVGNDQDFIFHETDIVGNDILFNEPGSVFTIVRTGLYHVEWSVNLSGAGTPTLVGLLENGLPTSALTNNASVGNYSSGALIYADVVPYTITLHNFGAPLTIANPLQVENTAGSIRILRFADGPAM